jgi:hypothetical protein
VRSALGGTVGSARDFERVLAFRNVREAELAGVTVNPGDGAGGVVIRILPRFLSISLLISIGIAPGVAQPAQSPRYHAPTALPNPFAAQPLPGSRIPPPNVFAQNPNAKDASARPLNSTVQKQLNPRTLKRLNPFVYRANDLYALEAPQGPVLLAIPEPQIAHNDERCYAIRDYRFSRVAPESDATRLVGSSTCEPAGQVRLKGATALAR